MKLIPILACTAIFSVPSYAQQEGGEREQPKGSEQEGRQDPAPQDPAPERPRRGGGFGLDATALAKLLAKYDKNKDAKIERSEYPRSDAAFANLDRDKNGSIDATDLTARPQRGQRPTRGQGQGRGEGAAAEAPPKLPKVGDKAPDFDLPMLGMKDTTVKLSSFAGKRPVALIFGSYT